MDSDPGFERCKAMHFEEQCELSAGHSKGHKANGGEWYFASRALEPSPRARDVAAYWDATGKCTSCGAQGNGMQACGTCFGLGGQLGTFNANFNAQQQQRASAANAWAELVTTKAALELLKKEVEDLRAMKKLRGEPDAPKFKTVDGEIVGRVLDERNALRRELENLKRRSEGCIADVRGEIATVHASREGLILENAFLKRELDRERAKNKRRGI